MNTDHDRIITRLQKLLALASNNPNQAEAASAAAKAQALMLEHNLSMAHLEARGERTGEEYIQHRVRTTSAGWRKLLLTAIAQTNFCRPIILTGPDKGHIAVIGKPTNTEAVAFLYSYLAREIERLAIRAWDELDEEERWDESVTQWRQAFRAGAADTVRSRLYAQHREQKEASTATGDATRALVLVSDAQLKAATARYFPRLGKARISNASSSHSARQAGMAGGHSITIPTGAARQITGA